MMANRMNGLRSMMLALLAGGLNSACVTGPVAGKVVDSDGKPVSDAIVVVTWSAYTGIVDTSKSCFHVERTTTREDGRFRMGGFSTSSLSASKPWAEVWVFKPNYSPEWVAWENESVVKLRIDTDPPDVRFHRLRQVLDNSVIARCGQEDGSNGNLFKLQTAVLKEAESLATTAKQLRAVRGMAREIEEDLVDFRKPTKIISAPDPDDERLVNENPSDGFKREDLLK